jgi:hypothetical protein
VSLGDLEALLERALKVQHQIPWQTGQVPEAGIRPAEIRDAPRLAGRGQEDRPGLTLPDGLRQRFARASTADPEKASR